MTNPTNLPFLCPQCGARGSTDGKASTFRSLPESSDPSLLGRETVREALEREEKYLHALIDDEDVGSVMHGDIEGAFHRLQTSLSPKE